MDVLGFATLVVTGFVACAEFGSYAFVHPVLRGLPPTAHLTVEQGLLRMFGRVMPVGNDVVRRALERVRAPGSGRRSAAGRWLAAASRLLRDYLE